MSITKSKYHCLKRKGSLGLDRAEVESSFGSDAGERESSQAFSGNRRAKFPKKRPEKAKFPDPNQDQPDFSGL